MGGRHVQEARSWTRRTPWVGSVRGGLAQPGPR
eukprot:CAMPEP_0179359902 /NCGR_PEP_ID=MMETSP0797-20121207/79688_1 /TAXON_ID=47934 /ORGANISM="Dinophysis acuminata, Strain DAEP01" /LENGTH=32 /DNA_ID= /DNA_START= /DNA_END= /DNA_ORIENTATION=